MSRDSIEAFPEIVEEKETLSGAKKTFVCRKIRGSAEHVVVLYIADRVIEVAGLQLPAGTVTFGYFWTHRPYNVYQWLTPAGVTLGHYINLSSNTTLDGERLSWRDLTLDVMVLPGQAAQVLDREELPLDLPDEVSSEIERILQVVLDGLHHIVPALENEAEHLWPLVFKRPRREEDQA